MKWICLLAFGRQVVTPAVREARNRCLGGGSVQLGPKGTPSSLASRGPTRPGDNQVKSTALATPRFRLPSTKSINMIAIAHFTFFAFFSVLVVSTFCSTDDVGDSRAPRALFSFGSRGSSLTRSQIFDMPNVVAVLFALTFFIFLLPFRMLRFSASTAGAQSQPNVKVNVKTQQAAMSMPLTEEAAHLTRKILDAIESDWSCVNHTACKLAADVKKVGNADKQETVLNMLRILLPAKWKPSVEILKEAMVAKQLEDFCHQFVCEENDVDPMIESDDFQVENTSTVDWVAAEGD